MRGKFHTGEHEKFGRRSVREHRGIKNGEKYITLDISLNFGGMEKMKITSLEPKYCLGISGKGLIIYLGIKTIKSPKKNKNARYAITNVILKDISKIIKEIEDLPYRGYAQKRSNHVPADSYVYLERNIEKCMARLNMNVVPVRTQRTNTQNMNNSEMSM